jgi:hypothetical protein
VFYATNRGRLGVRRAQMSVATLNAADILSEDQRAAMSIESFPAQLAAWISRATSRVADAIKSYRRFRVGFAHRSALAGRARPG